MATASYPPGKTFFSTMKRSYVDVPVYPDNDNNISTSEFLEANESLVALLTLLGSSLSLVTADITNNIQKVRTRQLEKPADSESIQDLVKNELKDGKTTASEGLLWLVRGLEFASVAMKQNADKPKQKLVDGFQYAYSNTLSKHHAYALQLATKTLLAGAVPHRTDFESKLGSDPALVEAEMKPWIDAFEKIVAILTSFMASPLLDIVVNPPKKEKKWGIF